MELQFDEAKRILILEDRGLDIAKSGEVFAGFHLTRRDGRHSRAEEERFNSIGLLNEEVVIVTWTARGAARRIVTMWKANGKEREKYHHACNRPR